MSVSILGCGWLGLPLAQRLLRSAIPVKGSTTELEKMSLLRAEGIEPYFLRCAPDLRGDGIAGFLQSRILILTLPFRRDLVDPADYLRQIESVLDHVRASEVNWIVFTSSTSVYPDDCLSASEDVDLAPSDPRANVLLSVERMLTDCRDVDTTILRLAGLYGPDRPIGRFLAGRKSRRPGDAPVNLVHQDDVIAVICRILETGTRNEILNVCSDGHPSREKLYGFAAERGGYPPPVFEDSGTSPQKVVSNAKLKEILDYRFLHADPIDDV